MIFQSELTNIDSEITALLAQIEAKKQRQSRLTELDALTDNTLEQLGAVVSKVGCYAPDAIASLKSAVLTLFDSGDGGNDGGNQPTDPTPGPDDDEPELLCLNGLTGECLTTADLDEEFPVDDPTGDEWVLSSSAPLTGQTCAIEPELYWEVIPPDGSSWEFASPLACLLWEDAPLLGQHCTITPSTSTDNENKSTTGEGKHMPYIELVTHPENEALGYQRKHDGEIVCCYIGFNAKARASSWQLFVEAMTDSVELRPATRMSGFKYELKIKGLSKTQVDRLAQEVDIKKSYHKPWNGEASKPPTYKEPERFEAVNPDEVEPGDIVTPLLTPGDSYEVIQVMPNGILDCKSMRTGVQMGMRPGAVSLVQKKKVVPPCPFVEDDLVIWKGCTLRIKKIGVETLYCVSPTSFDSTSGYTKVPIVECVAALPSEPQLEDDKHIPPVVTPTDPKIEFNDLVEVITDGLDCVGLVGAFGRVKTVKGDRIGVEIDEQLVFFSPQELSIKAKAEAPIEQQQQLQTGQTLLGGRIVTSGNYFGAARRNAISNARRGTANKLAALELVKAGLSPTEAMAAATGTDDASDF